MKNQSYSNHERHVPAFHFSLYRLALFWSSQHSFICLRRVCVEYRYLRHYFSYSCHSHVILGGHDIIPHPAVRM